MPNSLKRTLLFMVLVSPITYAQSENPWIEIGYQGADRNRVLWWSMARAGITEAQFNLGLAYSRGERGYRQNHKKAFHWLTRAAEQGYPPAENNLGVYHILGRGIPVDQSQAHFWFQRAFAHDSVSIGYMNLQRIRRLISGIDRWSPTSTHIPPAPARIRSTPEPDGAKQVNSIPRRPLPSVATTPMVTENKKRGGDVIVEKSATEKHSASRINIAEPMMMDTYELNPCTFVPEHFTLQLLGAHSRKNVVQYVRNGSWDRTIGYVSIQRESRDWFVVIFGDYADKVAAAQAKQQLMKKSKKLNSWVRSFSSLTPGHSCQSHLSTVDQSNFEQPITHTFRRRVVKTYDDKARLHAKTFPSGIL